MSSICWGGYEGEHLGPLMREKISETETEVGDHVSFAVDDIDSMVDVKELIHQSLHRESLSAVDAVAFREFLLKHEDDLVFHPQLRIVEEEGKIGQ